mgnify:FL=1|tara:strand:- start:992 stop:1723 length:732 start_codon:yes stop_codon:yes gene_type:complete
MTNYNDFLNGLFSGITTTIICNPLDVIRTNKQLSNKIDYNFKFLYRGLKTSLITIPSFWSIYFGTYKILKKYNNSNFSIFNGYLASNLASTITCPLWFIRQKNQVISNFNVIEFYKSNGIKVFYNTLFTTYLINSSFIVQMPLYEYLKKKEQLNKYLNDSLKIIFITAFSKTIASIIFYPIDTIRTHRRNFNNMYIIDIINNLNSKPLNYYNGLSIYLFRSIPYHCITFCTFEFLNKLKYKKK